MEANLISWPSRVVQLPDDDESQKPPVVTAVRLHRDGQLLATAGDDHLVRVWSLADGKLVHKLDAAYRLGAHDRLFARRPRAGLGRQRPADHLLGRRQRRAARRVRRASSRRSPRSASATTASCWPPSASKGRCGSTTWPRSSSSPQPPAPCQDMRAVAFSPDDPLLAAGGRCGTIRLLLDCRSGDVRPRHPGPPAADSGDRVLVRRLVRRLVGRGPADPRRAAGRRRRRLHACRRGRPKCCRSRSMARSNWPPPAATT